MATGSDATSATDPESLEPMSEKLPASPAAETTAAIQQESVEPLPVPAVANKRFVLGVVNASHFLNHVQSSLGAVLFPVMMQQMGFDFLALGLLSSMYQLSAQAMQVVYGMLAQYYRRSMLLGIGNVIVGLGGLSMGFTQSFTQVLSIRVLAGAGSSAQHPVGSAILTSYFRKAKGRVLGFHHTAGNAGSFVSPLIAVAMLTFLDWRSIWIILGIPSVLMGCAYFFFRDSIAKSGESSKKRATKIGLSNYIACLRNREVMVVSAIQMVGAAGRGTGVNQTYFVPFFMIALGADTAVAGLLLAVLQLGGLAGPVGIGWLSDRISRRLVLYGVMLFSTISTVALLFHSQITPALLLNVIVYGAVVNARGSLTQTMVADAVPDEQTDAAFSLYFFIGFISGPLWTAITGYLIDSRGFSTAFVVISTTYLAGMALIAFLSPRKKRALSAGS